MHAPPVLSFALQVPDIVTELFKMLYNAIRYSPIMIEIVKGIMAIFAFLRLMPLFAINNLELQPFSVKRYNAGELPFDFDMNITLFGFTIAKRWIFWKNQSADMANPNNPESEEEVALLLQRVKRREVYRGRCEDEGDLMHNPTHTNCSSESFMQLQEEGGGMVDNMILKAKKTLFFKGLGWVTKLLNMGLGLFGFKLYAISKKVDGVDMWLTITLEAYKNIFVALLETLGKFLLDILKWLINKILRPIPFVSPMSIMKCKPIHFTTAMISGDQDLSGADEEAAEECMKAGLEDGGYCKFINSEENNLIPLKDRPPTTLEHCIENPKCWVPNGKSEESCDFWKCDLCEQKTVANRCKANPKCSWRDTEDYELLQTQLSKSLTYHLQEVVNVPEVAVMPPLQLWTRLGTPQRAKMHVHSNGTEMTMEQVLAHNRQTDFKEDAEFDDEAEAATLIHQIPMDFDGSCKRMKQIIRKKGLKRFKELTGRKRPLHCNLSLKQKRDWARTGRKPWALSLRQYDEMTDHMQARMARILKPQLLQWRDEEGERRKSAVLLVVKQSHDLEERRVANEKQEVLYPVP